jgi:hypothetical protein
VIYPLATTAAEGLATDAAGNLFASDDQENNSLLKEIDAAGSLVDSCCVVDARLPFLETNVVTAAGAADLYVAHHTGADDFIEVRGPAPDLWPPPLVPPSIEDQGASFVGEDSARIEATINPNFWDDSSYHLQYGSEPCSGGGCTETAEVQLGAGIVKEAIKTDPVVLEGLLPDTTYHYRFVAESGGGGPVYGKGGTEAEDGAEGTFTTFTAEPTPGPCANDKYRLGPGALLWDCRAYEMVSPLDKLSGDILTIGNINETPSQLRQASPGGEAIAYSSYRSFGDAESSPYTVQYLANRHSGGWQTEGISPPREGPSTNPTAAGTDSQYRGFAEDLSAGWLVHDTEPLLAPGAVHGFQNLYRQSLPAKGYEALSSATPSGIESGSYRIELQGFSAEGSRTVFRANGKLTANAVTPSNPGQFQVYEAVGGEVRLVSVKPNGFASTASSSVGAVRSALNNNREANVATAVSEDGRRIYWSEDKPGSGPVYLRVNGTQTKAVSAANATFWAASPDGSAAIYEEGGALELYELASESSTTLAPSGVQGVVGQSEDLSRVYFVSSSELAAGAVAGQPNLFLYEQGAGTQLVASLSAADFLATEPSIINVSPRLHLARVSADGGSAVFMSRTALTGADNLDALTGEPDAEVFRYEAASGELRCVSCNPSGARAPGRGIKIDGAEAKYRIAAELPGWEFQLHAPRVLSADGKRVYFESLGRLVPGDRNDYLDVYQWQAPDSGQCSEASANYYPQNDGCLSLISSGEEESDTEFVDASADGRDVFVLTRESLVSWDPGQVDIYDARTLGGFPAPPPIPQSCQGEACQPQIAPPPPPANQSQAAGPGNPKTKIRCGRGLIRKKGRCVAKHHRKKHKAQKHRGKCKQKNQKKAKKCKAKKAKKNKGKNANKNRGARR